MVQLGDLLIRWPHAFHDLASPRRKPRDDATCRLQFLLEPHPSFETQTQKPSTGGFEAQPSKPLVGNVLHMLTPRTRHVPLSSSIAWPSSPQAPLLDLPVRRLNLVNMVHLPCTLALVDDPRCQPPTVGHPASLVPRSKSQHPSLTAPSPSPWTRLTFTFAADHCI
jgi:hypothetical protein